ncbi:MAG TPA: hypothetical protein VFJ24_09845 [Gaiellales bacterium]|nr:hypothetical protein [Gaiellales bacterium]
MTALFLSALALIGALQQEDRWQLTLNNGTILWELRLVRLTGDTLVVRRGDSTYHLPLGEIDELRLVRKSEHRTNEPGLYGDALGGVVDEVYRFTLYTVAERQATIALLLQHHPPPPQGKDDLWQITLKDGTIVWNLRLEGLRRDTLVFHSGDRAVRYPLLGVDELRLVQGGEHEIGPVAAGGRYDGAPNGASDRVYQLTLLDLTERRRVVQEILKTRRAARP